MKTIYSIVYNPFINKLIRPFALIFYKLTSKKIITISGILNLKYKNHNFELKTNQTCSVTQDLFFHGVENYEFTPLFEHLIKDSSVFFDVGANIGLFTILGEKINPKLKTYTFEPSKGPSFYVEENIKLNNLKNVNLIKKAVSHIDGKLTFYDVINKKYPWVEHNLNGSNSLQNNFGLEKSSSYEVEVVQLETIINQNQLNQVDIIKLDTECTEHLILESSKNIISRFKPIIICEVYDVIANEIQDIINSLYDYEIYQYRQNNIVKISHLQSVSADTTYRNFIFCPTNKVEKIKVFIK